MVAILLAVLLGSEVTQADVDAYAEVSAGERAARADSLAEEIERLKKRSRRSVLEEYRATKWEHPKKRPSTSEYVKQERVNRDIRIQGLQQRLEKLLDERESYYSDKTPTDIGQIGRLEYGVRVIQVIDGKNAIVRLSDEGEYWLRGVLTTKWRDGVYVQLNGLFYVPENTTYETAAGTNTVYVLEPIDLSKHADKFKAAPRATSR